MVRHHLPPEYAAPARAYLGAFLGEREAADAMYEVVEDVTYWGDDSLASVLSAAHSVLTSRMRITSDAAASWLVEELGLQADVASTITGGKAVADHDERPVSTPAESAPVEPAPDTAETVEPQPAPPDPTPPAEPVRIGFDEGPLPTRLFDDPPSLSRARLVGGMLVIGGLLLVAVLLITR
jgi:hypothetical protein